MPELRVTHDDNRFLHSIRIAPVEVAPVDRVAAAARAWIAGELSLDQAREMALDDIADRSALNPEAMHWRQRWRDEAEAHELTAAESVRDLRRVRRCAWLLGGCAVAAAVGLMGMCARREVGR